MSKKSIFIIFCMFILLVLIFITKAVITFDGNSKKSTLQNLTTSRKNQKSFILVTSGAGYIGSHAALALLEQGYEVLVVDNMSRGSQKAIKILQGFSNFQFENLDLESIDGMDNLFRKYEIDVVMHFAGFAFVQESIEKPQQYYYNIEEITRYLADCMLRHGVQKIIY